MLHDPTISAIAAEHRKTAAQVMLRWQLQRRRSAIPKSTNPGRIAENFDVFDFDLTAKQMSGIDALDTGVRNGPDPDVARPALFDRVVPEDADRRRSTGTGQRALLQSPVVKSRLLEPDAVPLNDSAHDAASARPRGPNLVVVLRGRSARTQADRARY